MRIMNTGSVFSVRGADWVTDGPAVRDIRLAVFVREQGVPEALEWDDADAASVHVLAVDTTETPIGTGRLLPNGQVGRMAVHRAWRGRGNAGLADRVRTRAR